MTVIDVDSHYEPLLIDPADHPLNGLGLDLPPPEVIAMESLAGDLWNQTGPSTQEALAPEIPILKLLRGVADEDTSEQLAAMMERHPAADDPDKRVEWLDSVGIDTEWSVGEMERMRGMGSRSVFLRACPFAGRSPAHPANDPLWSAMASLGMVGVVHIGATPARFDGGWADADWMAPGAGGVGGYIRFANAARIPLRVGLVRSAVVA